MEERSDNCDGAENARNERKLIEDLRKKINEPFENKDSLAVRIVEGFQDAGKGLTEKASKLREEVGVKIAKKWSDKRVLLSKWSRVLDDCINLRLNVLADSIRDSPRCEELNSLPPMAFMESPRPIQTGRGYSGKPVYYVNGIWTRKDRATAAAEALAKHLKRPVFLIHNISAVPSGWLRPRVSFRRRDVLEAAYDTIWPLLICTVPLGRLLAIGSGTIQLNAATARLTHLFYNAAKPISVVSHSEGCIVVRNACFALFLLNREEWIREKLAWVTAGSPLNDNVVWPKPDKYTALNLPMLSFRHSFVRHYLHKINPEMLW
ncbi:MAG TPA: hypothetical protein VMC85_03945 [Desulfomonilaceae bacterium]|nr:hypothetical protein [Desulfomonilaceae bacterium]